MTALKLGNSTVVLGAAVLMVFGTTGCATKKHVRQVVAPVEARVSANEKKTSDHASAIGELENGVSKADERAMDAERKATAAGQNADKANAAAADAAQRADNARGLAESTRSRLGEVVDNMDNYKLVNTQSVLFNVGKSTLTKEAKQQLDEAVTNIVNNKNYILEVEGYTDKTGTKALNLTLSQKRADEVVRYLTVQHNVPLRKIHVLGIGADDPNADNKTRAARKQNRRVDVKVFALDLGGAPQKDANSAATQQRTEPPVAPSATTPPPVNQ
jgi:outer membrane protein OmpA-like peptidoglycan-associated protein